MLKGLDKKIGILGLAVFLAVAFFACKQEKGSVKDVVVSKDSTSVASEISKIPVQYNLEFDRFSVDNGLLSNSITDLYQDSRGFLWIGTDEGLSRYDGYGFKHYLNSQNDTNTIINNHILNILEDKQGHIWLQTKVGISKIDVALDKVENFTDSTYRATRFDHSHFIIDADRRLFFRFSKVYFDITTKQFIPIDGEGEKYSCSYARNNENSYQLWYKIIDGGRYLFIKKLNESMEKEIVDSILISFSQRRSLALDDNGILWGDFHSKSPHDLMGINLTTGEQKLFAYEKGRQKLRFSLGGTINDVCLSKADDNVMWLATWGGLVRVEKKSRSKTPILRYSSDLKNSKSLSSNQISCVLEDFTGNLWVGSMNGGLCKYSPYKNKFKHVTVTIPDSTTLAHPFVNSIYFDSEDRLWVGTNKGLSLLTDRNDFKFKTFKQPRRKGEYANHDWVRGIVEDEKRNQLYVAFWGGNPMAFDFNDMEYQYLPMKPYQQKLLETKDWFSSSSFITGVSKGINDNYYFSNWGGGIALEYMPKENSLKTSFFTKNIPKVKSSHIISLYIDKEGKLWTGNDEEKGLQISEYNEGESFKEIIAAHPYVVDSTGYFGTLIQISSDPTDSTALQSGQINCFFEDGNQNLWLGTKKGLHLVTDKEKYKFKCFDQNEGFRNESIQGILEDGRGNLWVSTMKGMHVFSLGEKCVVAYYDVNDGLQSNQFNTSACAKNKDGLMVFGGPNGINVFHPDSLLFNQTLPMVQLLDFKIKGLSLDRQADSYTVDYSKREDVEFSFASMDFSNPKKNHYQYYLEGFDSDWSAITTQNKARYTNLPHGEYVFKVRGSNNDGIWSVEDLAVPLIIKPPFYFQNWFLALLGVLIALAICFAFMQIQKRFEKRSTELDMEQKIRYLQVQTLQAQINPHFLFNLLMGVQAKILGDDREAANRILLDLATLMRNFLEASIQANITENDVDSDGPIRSDSSMNEVSLKKEIQLLDTYCRFEQMKSNDSFTFSIKVAESLNPANENIPPFLIQPYVENSIIHGILYLKDREGKLEIEFSKIAEDILCAVRDNGVGMDKSREIQQKGIKLFKSRGKYLVEERVRILNHMEYVISISDPKDIPTGGTEVLIRVGYKE